MRRLWLPFALLALVMFVSNCSAQASGGTGTDAVDLWRAGDYDRAVAIFTRNARNEPSWQERRAHTHVLLELARHADAEAVAADYASRAPADSALVADVAAARGNVQLAEQAYRAALEAASPDSARVLAALASVLARQGRWDDAHALDERAILAGRETFDPDALIVVAAAHERAGRLDPQRFRDALAVLDRALESEPDHPGVQAALADLFLSKYNAPDARTSATAALEKNPRHPQALLAEARRRRFENQPGADSLVELVLELAPESVRGRAQAGLLFIDAENAESAQREAEAALAVDASDSEALAVLAASHLLVGDSEAVREVESRARQSGAAAGEFYAILAEYAARVRRYGEAARLALEGARVDPRQWRAHAVAGVNLLRIGKVDSARTALETAFAGDPYDPWTKNTLDLLDSFDRFEERSDDRFVLMVESEEADLMAPYLLGLLSAAFDSLSSRYHYVPDGPVRLELYRRHADFSVRTVGLAGLGALGVSFGDVLAMDSPAARESGQFNYGSTAWHELAHTFTLGLSEGKVPRWLSEGISVYEERRARPGFGSRPDPAMLLAYASDSLPPPSRLGEAFANPGTPARLGQAYTLASLVAEYIADTRGDQALPAFVKAFAGGVSQDEAMHSALQLSAEQLDSGFDAWMKQRFPAVLNGNPERSVQAFVEATARGARELQSGRAREALVPLSEAIEALPDYGGVNAPRALAAAAQLAIGDTTAAISLLEQHTSLAETDHESNLLLASLYEGRGDSGRAVAPLDRTVWLLPYDTEVHSRLAAAASAAGKHDLAVRERRALVALKPTDMAGARYELALSLRDAGQFREARSEVLRALEIAPNFADAQDLLLELRSSGNTPERSP